MLITQQDKIDRINYLARKSRTEGLSEDEKTEQEALRNEYRNNIKRNLLNQLNNVYIADEKSDRGSSSREKE